jgi:hypothetical protein
MKHKTVTKGTGGGAPRVFMPPSTSDGSQLQKAPEQALKWLILGLLFLIVLFVPEIAEIIPAAFRSERR